MRTKNKCNRTRKVDSPYEIWMSRKLPNWEWRVLKKWQSPKNEEDNPYARWYCAVRSPMTYGSWEYGDVYVREIKSVATRKK